MTDPARGEVIIAATMLLGIELEQVGEKPRTEVSHEAL
jgi:hypothetical protein